MKISMKISLEIVQDFYNEWNFNEKIKLINEKNFISSNSLYISIFKLNKFIKN